MMQITAANVGDILLFSASGKQYKIEEVNNEYVYYSSETGERYASTERTVDALKLTDPISIERFESYATLGRNLAAAETSALRKILSPGISPEDRDDAIRVLGVTHQQQKHLQAQITAARKAAIKKPSSLADLISGAEKRKASNNRPVSQERSEPSR